MEMTLSEQRDKIIEKFQELKAKSVSDVKFDRGSLEKSFDCTMKIAWWINMRTEWSKAFRTYEYKRNNAWKKAYEYYRTEYQLKLETKEEFKLMVDSDPDYFEAAELTKLVQEIINFIDSVIDNMKARQWEIKNCMEWQKFTNGVG